MRGDYTLGTWPQRMRFLSGAIAEAMIYDEEPVAQEREVVEQYPIGKYSVAPHE